MKSNGRTNRYSTRGNNTRVNPAAGKPGHANYNPYSGHKPTSGPNRSADKVKSVTQFTVAVIVAAIPISFYLVQPGDLQNAIASNHTSEDIKQILNTIGGSIKDKAGNVFNDGRTIRVKKQDSHDHDHSQPDRASRQQPVSAPSRTQQSTQQQFEQPRGERPPEPVRSEPVRPIVAQPQAVPAGAPKETAMQHAAKHANPNYICPMHPDVINSDPNAICPICGMDLVLLEAGGEAGTGNLSPTVINTLGVRTAKTKRRTLFRKINSVGYVELDETKLRTVNLRVDGWIEKLHVSSEGDRVEEGQPLFELYSPKLVNAQEEYVQAMQHQNELVMKASRDRLLSLGVSLDQINLLQTQEDVQQHVVIRAPQKGVISNHKIREGQFVKPSQTLLEIVDLDTIWVIAEIFESQSDWVKKGQRAKASLPYLPGESIEGMVDYVYPSLDPKTRSLKVRLKFDNPNESIKPNMYADVAIFAKPKKKVLTIPREALITTGDDNRVIISMGEGKFIPMQVKVGMRTDKGVEILRGLAEGDVVVTSSQFLIDSESSLKASLAKMAGGG